MCCLWEAADHAPLSTVALAISHAAAGLQEGILCCASLHVRRLMCSSEQPAPTFCSSSPPCQAGLGVSWILTLLLQFCSSIDVWASVSALVIRCYLFCSRRFLLHKEPHWPKCCANKGKTITKTSLCLKELTASPLFLPASVNKSLVMSLFFRGR